MISELETAIQSNPYYPVPQVTYGLSDKFVQQEPRVFILNLKTVGERDTSGIAYTTTTFELHIFAASFDAMEEIDDALKKQLDEYPLTQKTMQLFWDSSDIVTEPLFQYHVRQSYTLTQNG